MSSFTLVRSAGALLVLAVGLFIAPLGAWAGCAHPSLVQSASDPLGQLLDRFTAANELPPWPDSGRPRPCFGPSCSDAPPRATAPLATAGREVESWACPALPCAATGPGDSSRPPELGRVRPIHEGTGVFHPPRQVRPYPFPTA